MGYTTKFSGDIYIEPPLNPAEQAFLKRFAETRRMDRRKGPYYLCDSEYGQDQADDIRSYNRPPEGQPGLWCQWVPYESERLPQWNGNSLVWDGNEKFYCSAEWMVYLIDHFLRPDAEAKGQPGFEDFTFDHVCTGVIQAHGEDSDDVWQLIVKQNEVYVATAEVVYGKPVPVKDNVPVVF